jgi:3-phenylpropionate/trans-cinnamate dioxygenase ferredoxin reductase subunit
LLDSWSDVPGFWSEFGDRTLKYTAWGDGFDHDELIDHEGGGFTVWYSRAGRTVGVLTHRADEDYERGAELIADGAPPPVLTTSVVPEGRSSSQQPLER